MATKHTPGKGNATCQGPKQGLPGMFEELQESYCGQVAPEGGEEEQKVRSER